VTDDDRTGRYVAAKDKAETASASTGTRRLVIVESPA
jgi:hypothetical protein